MHIEKFRFTQSFRPCPSSPHVLVGLSCFPARAYVLSSNLNPDNLPRAETALNELLDSIPSDDVSIHQPARYCCPPDVAPSRRT